MGNLKFISGILVFFLLPLLVFGQPGQIIESGNSVLDPNQDGFISTSNNGFSGDIYDVDEFELSMFGIPIIGDGEAVGDNQSGPTCGTTDFALDTAGYALYAAFDDNQNLIFRLRLADNSPSVRSYSILIDTDEAVGPDDPNSSSENPGFEIAITFIQKFGVYLYNIDGSTSCPSPLETYNDATHQQKALSAQQSCGTQDIYVDFYVPFADLTTHFGITPSSNLRFVGVTNISATCALDGSISDIGGVDDRDYNGCFSCAVLDLTNNQCPTSIDKLCATCDGFPIGFTPTPQINQPLLVGSQVIDGTAGPSSEIYIELFSAAGLLIDRDTTLASPDSSWTSGNFIRPLEFGDSLVVNAFMSGMCLSGENDAGLSYAIVNPNQSPVLNGSTQTINYPATGPPVLVFEDIIVTDDNETLSNARLEIVQNYEIGSDILDASPPPGISFTFSPTEGVLEFTGIASLSDYQQALRSIVFYNTSSTPDLSIRQVSLVVSDGNSLSTSFGKNIIVVPLNELPVVTGSTDTLVYYEGDGPVILDNLIDISDLDDTELVTATLTFTAGFDSGDDTLVFAPKNGLISSFDNQTLTLIGTTTLLKYQNSLRTITYENNSPAPTTLLKTIEIIVNDGTSNSIPFYRHIKIIPTIEPPEITIFSGGGLNDTITFTEGDPPVALIPQLDVQDADDINLEGCTVRFNNNYRGNEDSLVVSLDFGIQGGFDGQAGILELSGSASIASYQAILRTVGYVNASENPDSSQRLVEIFAFDGDSVSNSLFIAINVIPVNDPPEISGSESPVAYPESSGPVILATDLLLLDPDDTLITSATVTIASNFTAPEDILSFSEVQGITASYNGLSGVLQLDGTASPEDYQALLRSVSYENSNPIANRQPRIVTFTASDGELESNTYEIEIILEEVIDPVIVYQLVTPDGDGLNDTWEIDGILQYPENEIKLFNRWNNLVFETSGYDNNNNSWTGQANTGFTTGDLPDGTYFYTIDLKNGSNLLEGFIVLKRK